jgi:hypothetical protein
VRVEDWVWDVRRKYRAEEDLPVVVLTSSWLFPWALRSIGLWQPLLEHIRSDVQGSQYRSSSIHGYQRNIVLPYRSSVDRLNVVHDFLHIVHDSSAVQQLMPQHAYHGGKHAIDEVVPV